MLSGLKPLKVSIILTNSVRRVVIYLLMKKILFSLPIILLIAGLVALGVFVNQIEKRVTQDTIALLEKSEADFKKSNTDTDRLTETTFSYDEVSTNGWTQTTTIKNIVLGTSNELSDHKLSIGSVDVTRNFWNADKKGHTKKATVIFKDVSFSQSTEYDESLFKTQPLVNSVMAWASKPQTTAAQKITIKFEGDFPNQFEDAKQAALTILASDQKLSFAVEEMTSTLYQQELPFLALLSNEQKSGLGRTPKFGYELNYSTDQKSIEFVVPEYSETFTKSEGKISLGLDASKFIETQDEKDLKLGKFELLVKSGTLPEFANLVWGDGKDLGKHSFGGFDSCVYAKGDLSELSFHNTTDSTVNDKIAKTISADVHFSLRDLSVDLNTTENPQTHKGIYTLQKLEYKFGGDFSKLTKGTQPEDLIQGLDFKFDVAELSVTPPAGLSMMLGFMGLSKEQAASPKIHELKLDWSNDKGVFDLSKNGIKTNFGSLNFQGNFDMPNKKLNNVEVTLVDAPAAIYQMLTKSLPAEVKQAIKQDGTTYKLKVSGSAEGGLSYE